MFDVIHRALGLTIAGIFLLIALFGLFLWIRNRDAGPIFWNTLAAGQIGLALQVLFGIVMFVRRGSLDLEHLLHMAYGTFPVLVLVYVHLKAKRKEAKGLGWVAFAIAGLIIFGLQTRGFMTGSEF